MNTEPADKGGTQPFLLLRTKAILIVTHTIDEAVSMADRVLMLGADPVRIRFEMLSLPLAQRSF